MKKLLLTVLCASLLLGPIITSVRAETVDPYQRDPYMQKQDFPSGEKMAGDLILVRPLGLAACVLGLAAAIVATPFIVTSCSGRETYQTLVGEPFAFTFKRPLGTGF